MSEGTWNPMSQQYERPTLTLADFLLARIAEDEAGAHMLEAREVGDVPVTEWLGFLPGRSGLATRVLAECEAKRRIVAAWQRALTSRRDHPDDLGSAGALLALEGVINLLALPYADHPDFRDEWRLVIA